MSYQLPPNLLRLFQPRPQLPFVPANKKDRDPRKLPTIKKSNEPPSKLIGVGLLLEQLKQDAADKGEVTVDVEILEGGKDELGKEFTLAEQTKRELKREEKKKIYEENKSRQLESFDPSKDPEAQGDPFTTLFLSRLDYAVTEKDLQKEFEMYGPISRIRVVTDKKGKSRGYAFVVYEKERDMRGEPEQKRLMLDSCC